MEFFVKNDDYKEELRELEERYSNLPEKVKEYFSRIIITKLNFILSDCEECQSPIEQLMFIALNEQLEKVLPYYTTDFFIKPQDKIEVNKSKYRVDFFIATCYRDKYHGFVIECDGHDFHEKTKEQAKKDKKRDRDLVQEGYTVIRFTGSEIYKNPTICAREVINIILSHFEKG
jgi:very-short-patch-repair endonuclease